MVSHNYLKTMDKIEHIKAYNLFLNDFTPAEIAREMGKTVVTINNWKKKWGWRLRKAAELRDIEKEMKVEVDAARAKVITAAALTLDDIIVLDEDGKPVRVNIGIEDVKDLRTITDLLLKVGGVPEKIEQKVTKEISGEISVKTEKIDPEVAAEIGRAIALKKSAEVIDESM